jgi:hypothetical protein
LVHITPSKCNHAGENDGDYDDPLVHDYHEDQNPNDCERLEEETSSPHSGVEGANSCGLFMQKVWFGNIFASLFMTSPLAAVCTLMSSNMVFNT